MCIRDRFKGDMRLSLGYRSFEFRGMKIRGHEFHYSQVIESDEELTSAAQVYNCLLYTSCRHFKSCTGVCPRKILFIRYLRILRRSLPDTSVRNIYIFVFNSIIRESIKYLELRSFTFIRERQ